LRDIDRIDEDHPAVLDAFMKGIGFTVTKSERECSNMAPDQAHEQNNKIIKTDGGAIGILDNEKTLLQWAVTSPELVKVQRSFFCDDTENNIDDSPGVEQPEKRILHHENNISFEKRHFEDVQSLLKIFDYSIPFTDGPDNQLMNISSKACIDASVSLLHLL